MSKKLAIKGYPTRGREVIELLEMIGGNNNFNQYGGNCDEFYYYIENDGDIEYIEVIDNDFIKFTLDEFYKKYPFKVGDRVLIPEYESEVRINRMVWNGWDMEYMVYRNDDDEWYTATELKNWNDDFYDVETKVESTGFMQLGKTFAVIFNDANYEDEVELQLGDYEIEVRDGKTYAVRKKSVFPKTYDECCQYLGCDDRLSTGKLVLLKQLINARNAYWKIAGEQMGLGKPWEPDWSDAYCSKYFITFVADEVNMDFSNVCNYILAFPTAEMRETFFENFKELIEQCKKFL